MVHISEHSLGIIERKLVEQRLQEAPPDVMIEVPLEDMGLFDLDRVDACLQAGQEAARRRVSELIELRDAPSPGRWTRWWQSLRRQPLQET
jgi:predicted acylesterase/phospholipase RssA